MPDDTTPSMEKKWYELMMQKSGAERMMMGFSMYDFSRALMEASIKNAHPTITKSELKKRLLLAFYSTEISKEILERL